MPAKEVLKSSRRPRTDFSGVRKGKLSVIKPFRGEDGGVWWKVRCKCGNKLDVCHTDLQKKFYSSDAPSCGCTSRNMHPQRTARMMDLHMQGIPLRDIGLEVGISGSRVGQILKRDERYKGLHTDRGFMSEDEAKRALGADEPGRATWFRWLKKMGLRRVGRYVLVPPEEFYVALEKLKIDCPECGGRFLKNSVSNLCSDECRLAYHGRNANQPERLAVPTKWSEWWSEHLSKVRPGKDYIGLGEACEVSGMSPMQMSWLALRGVLKTKESTRRNNSGGLQKQYNLAQCHAVAHLKEHSFKRGRSA